MTFRWSVLLCTMLNDFLPNAGHWTDMLVVVILNDTMLNAVLTNDVYAEHCYSVMVSWLSMC